MIRSQPVRLHRELMLTFIDDIVAGRLPVGERLPTEVALAERHDVSRGVAREILRGLEERGLIKVRHGSAMTVNPHQAWDVFNLEVLTAALSGPDAAELLEQYLQCRRIVEIEAAGLAAERATREQVQELGERLAQIKAAIARRPAREQEREYNEADAAFHQSLVDATGNWPLASLVRRIQGALLAAHYPLARPAYRRERAIPEHEAILAAVEAGAPDAARDAMRAHLDAVGDDLREHARRVARAA